MLTSKLNWRFWSIFFLGFLFFQNVMAVQDIYPFSNSNQKKQFNELIDQLRCLVCQNENLADSNAGLAKDLRNEIYTQVLAGKSNAEIRKYLVDRYGTFILFNPPINSDTWLLWLGPFFLVLLGLVILARILTKSRITKC